MQAARKELEESSESSDEASDAADATEEYNGHPEGEVQAAPDANATQQSAIQALLEDLRRRHAPADESPQTTADAALDLLRDRKALSKAQEMLSQKGQDKSIDVVFRARICAMVGVLNLYLDSDLLYSWRKVSMIVAKAQGRGPHWARSVRKWILDFVRTGTLPLHSYCYDRKTVLEEEGILQEIQEQLKEKAKGCFIKAGDVCEIVAGEKVQSMITQLGIHKPSISLATAHRWLSRLNWRYGQKKNGMYFDGHERVDVVAYRQAFVLRWAEYETRFQLWDENGNPLPTRSDSRPLVLITHDESVFFQNDERKSRWGHQDGQPTPIPKGEEQSLMVSDFLSPEWGCLCDSDRCVNHIISLFLISLSLMFLERLALCSSQARIGTGSLIPRRLSPKSTARSKFSTARQIVLPRAFLCSITHPVTSSVPKTPFLQKIWSKVRSLPPFFLLPFSLIDRRAPKIPSVSGRINQTGYACVTASTP